MKLTDASIVHQTLVAQEVYELKVSAPDLADAAEAGQFLHIQTGQFGQPLLRRPISIADIDRVEGTLTCLYKVVGKGTAVLAGRQENESLNILGPLGNGFPINQIERGSHVILIGGGVGIPPLYFLAKELVEKGIQCSAYLGFRSAEDVFYDKEFEEFCDVHIATEDGSYGHKGYVTDIVSTEGVVTYYACGPKPMLTKVKHQLPIQGFLSLEERMGCGVGACLACVCPTNTEQQYAKVCSDGPVFPSKEVIL
ncbi:dihydroorotate dehydrogenase electron transfer subunit [Salisediminibacterium beveridgei]|uniref:Dihydroorotate dehydrogenase B (NAD(+)), electron transfer subunit n=1 Tax=Salisediminibacterium beveridgei TaxID=632773 RepID=A0A1D7QW72_9BACI|nr:dihydroorotate dehydrogenase electron transfer subunit [Salisediminibacterium beveridgei]AOM83252.1 Dihydroorotate dehydrogenase electron transfer subunit [Salisediminibacterium beveridgei]